MNESIAVKVIRQEIATNKKQFESWAKESNGDTESFYGKLATEYLSKKIHLQILLEKVLKAEREEK